LTMQIIPTYKFVLITTVYGHSMAEKHIMDIVYNAVRTFDANILQQWKWKFITRLLEYDK